MAARRGSARLEACFRHPASETVDHVEGGKTENTAPSGGPRDCPGPPDCRYTYFSANAVFPDASSACDPADEGCCDQWTSIAFSSDGLGGDSLECAFASLRDRNPSFLRFAYLARTGSEPQDVVGVRGDYLWVFSNGQVDLAQQRASWTCSSPVSANPRRFARTC